METIENLFDKSVSEIERMLNTKTVVGEPITIDGNTLIPLVSIGFGFGVGSGKGTDASKGSDGGGGTGGGGGIKPIALAVINENGVRIESIKSGSASALEKVAETIGKVAGEKMAAAD